MTRDGWKLRIHLKLDRAVTFSTFGGPLSCIDDAVTYQLYYLPEDYREAHDLAAQHPDKVVELRGLLLKECDGNFVHGTPEAHFAFYNTQV